MGKNKEKKDGTIIIYKIWNVETGKMMIGTTNKKTVDEALKYWLYNCTRKTMSDYLIAKDRKEYGMDSFRVEQVCTCNDNEQALEIADSYIEQLGTLEPYGYNRKFLGKRKNDRNYYKNHPIENKEVVKDIDDIQFDEAILKVDFRKKAELLNKYGITGISENNVPQIFAQKETIKSLRNLADKLERYGSNEIYEFVPSELNDETNNIGKELLKLINATGGTKLSKATYMAMPRNNIQCVRCGGFKEPRNFFFRHPDKAATKSGYIHICRDCISQYCSEFYKKYNSAVYALLVLCQLTNVIFVKDVAEMAEKNCMEKKDKIEELFRYYVTELNYVWLNRESAPTSMLEFRNSNFRGDIFDFAEHHPATPKSYFEELNEDFIEQKTTTNTVDLGTDLELKWGSGFTEQEYMQLEQEYNRLEKYLPKKTDLHIEALKKYVIYNLKEKEALAKGDLKEVKDWNALADKAADNAQLKLKQLSDNFGAEVDGFAKLVEAIEEYDSVIPVLPKVKKMPYDDIDFLIWEQVNYLRRLEGKPETSYEEVYQFIDDELTKKMIDKGFTDEQIAKEKEKRNAVFNDLSDNYNEPLWMVPDEDDEDDEDEPLEEGGK